jgi:hypothetical protein
MKRDLEKARDRDRKKHVKKMQLEIENADKIAALEKAKVDLEITVARFERDLGEKQKELDKEKEYHKRLRESLSKDIDTWKGKYEIIAKYDTEERPSEY